MNLSNRTKINLFLDLALVLAVAAEMQLDFVGLRIHELLGLAIGIAAIIHIILHWQWIVGVTKSFFSRLMHESRFNYLLNIVTFVNVLVMVVTGIIISRTLGLNLGIQQGGGMSWQRIHILSAELGLLIVALHVAVHWKWIAAHAKKYLFSFRLPARRSPAVLVPNSPDNTLSSEV